MIKEIKNLSELKRRAKKGLDCYVALNYSLKSNKHISYSKKKFWVENHIDGSFNVYTEKQLLKSNIGKALEKGSLYAE